MSCPYHHCGITTSGTVTREGHCPCDECHAGPGDGFPASRIIRAGISDLPPGLAPRKTMCDRWYEHAGDYRPWQPGTHGIHVIREGTVTSVSLDLEPGPYGGVPEVVTD